ncbi:MAG: type I restriction enzyme R subunit [Bacteriovoracaceae bacterium]|jgi:type I restriction enzyme R subunit
MAGRSEAQTRKELIEPKLRETGWDEYPWQVEWEYVITKDRIIFHGSKPERQKNSGKTADYLLRYSKSKAIAIVEAKKEDLSHMEGEKQAKDYARKLGLWFAYSTNGHQIEFYNLKTNTQETVDKFHTPEELFAMWLELSNLENKPEVVDSLTHEYYDESAIGQRRKPRYYQETAVNKSIESILHGNNRVLITMATGTGKTFTSIQLVYKLWKAKFVKKILFIVDRNLLADQAFADFDNAMDKDACYRLTPKDDKFPLGRDLYFGIYQTLVGVDDEDENKKVGRPDRFKEFPPDYFDLIVIDEAHRGARRSQDGKEESSWFRLLKYFDKAIQVGLTATPKRNESNDTYAHFGEPVVTYSLKDGIEDGYLSPYIIKRVTSNIDALGYRPESGNIEDVKGQKLEVKDYLTPDFERKLSIPQRTRAFAYHLLRHLFATDPLGKTLVFCLDQRHALDMAKYCREAFAKYKVKYGLSDYDGDYAVRITGADKDSNGKYADLEKFQNLDAFQPVIVTTSRLLTTGVDVKNVKNVVIFRNIGSMVEFKQIIGRGTRTYEPLDKSREKLGFYILEYANYSTQLFNDPEWDDEAQDFVDEGVLVVDDNDEQAESPEAEVPVATKEIEENVTGEGESKGIYEENDEERAREIRFRMSEDFLSGRVGIVAETETLTIGGKPVDADDYILYSSKSFLQHVPDVQTLASIWGDITKRNQFNEETLSELEFSMEALKSIFFQKHGTRDVDMYDVLSNLIFKEKFLTKEERVQKAKVLNSDFFKAKNDKHGNLISDILSVYETEDFSSLAFTPEFFQVPTMAKHGGIQGIKDILGGMDETKTFVNGFQEALYDERISA